MQSSGNPIKYTSVSGDKTVTGVEVPVEVPHKPSPIENLATNEGANRPPPPSRQPEPLLSSNSEEVDTRIWLHVRRTE